MKHALLCFCFSILWIVSYNILIILNMLWFFYKTLKNHRSISFFQTFAMRIGVHAAPIRLDLFIWRSSRQL